MISGVCYVSSPLSFSREVVIVAEICCLDHLARGSLDGKMVDLTSISRG